MSSCWAVYVLSSEPSAVAYFYWPSQTLGMVVMRVGGRKNIMGGVEQDNRELWDNGKSRQT